MVFQYKVVIASGTAEGVEGTSAGLALISDFMQDCGWTLYDDRSAQAASTTHADHMKYVFSSNGESGNYPTYFITMCSGSSTTPNQDLIYLSADSAYDLGTHTTPASGVSTRVGTTNTDGNADNRLQMYSQSDNTEIHMSGDSEMVHIVTRKVNDNNSAATMDNVYFGRFNSFLSVEENPYPILVMGQQGAQIATISATSRGIGGNPPVASTARSKVQIKQTTVTNYDASQPYVNGVDSIFTAVPLMVTYENLNVAGQIHGVVGMVRNGWVSADASSLFNYSVLTASGSEGVQEYLSFTSETLSSTPSIIIRKS